MKNRAFILFGPPGSGKGTQGHALGSIPGFFHFSSGAMLRSLDMRTQAAKAMVEYSREGKLVPDELMFKLFKKHLENIMLLGKLDPQTDYLILDGIPRNVAQAKMMDESIDVEHVFHFVCSDRQQLIERIRKRALKEGRMDDTSDQVILKRLQVYEEETLPMLAFYGPQKITAIDALERPHQVLRAILEQIHLMPVA